MDEIESKMTFEWEDGNTTTTKQMHGDGITWMELTDEFANFVQGCGFIVTPEQIGQYLIERG